MRAVNSRRKAPHAVRPVVLRETDSLKKQYADTSWIAPDLR